jgi:hypothetical protein
MTLWVVRALQLKAVEQRPEFRLRQMSQIGREQRHRRQQFGDVAWVWRRVLGEFVAQTGQRGPAFGQ